MPLTTANEILRVGRERGHGCASCNVVTLEQISGVVTGAERADRPVILQISHNAVRYHGALAPLGRAALAAATQATVPVAVHLDHAESAELIHEAVQLGFGSVMYDGSTLEHAENVRRTAEVVAECHSSGVAVEAELGEVGGKDGVHAPGARTDPSEAREFVRATGVDALAVAVGSSHAMLTQDAELDFDLIAQLRAELDVPLVLHGSSGVPDADLARAVDSGMTKINMATRLNGSFTAAVREYLAANPTTVDTRKYLAPARSALASDVAELLRMFAPEGARS